MSATVEANPNELLTEDQAAELLGVSPDTLSVWRSTRRYDLTFIKIGRLVRYRRRDVDAWLQSREVNGTAAKPTKRRSK